MYSNGWTMCFKILLFILLGATEFVKATPSNELILLSGCTCSGDNIIYRCSVCGTGITATVWEGSAFDCPVNSNEISLRHSQFPDDATVACNGGEIVGYSVGVEQNCHISQLNITVSSNLNNRTVMCVYDDEGGTQIIVNTTTISINTDPFPPPRNLQLNSIGRNVMNFSWDPVEPSCASVRYGIRADNCGSCPSNTSETSIMCTNLPMESYCSLGVRTVVCDDIVGTSEEFVEVTIKVPNTPQHVQCIPTYNNDTRDIIMLDTSFPEVETNFTIYDGISGLATNFSIYYHKNISDSSELTTCDSATVPASLCHDGGCSFILNIVSSTCVNSSSIVVFAYATNLFGDSPPSQPCIADTTNQIIDVKFDHTTSSVTCEFKASMLSAGSNDNKSCSISYGPLTDNCTISSQSSSLPAVNDIARIKLPALQDNVTYCFLVTTTLNGRTVALVEGKFTNVSMSSSSATVIAIAVVISVLVIIAVIFIIVPAIVAIVKRRKRLDTFPLLSFLDDSGEYQPITFGANSDSFDEIEHTGYKIIEVRSTSTIRSTLNQYPQYQGYREFEGRTYFEFVQEEDKKNLAVILMYKVAGSNDQKLFKGEANKLPCCKSSSDPDSKVKPPKAKERGWRVFLQSYDSNRFLRKTRNDIPEEEKLKLDADVDFNQRLLFIITN